MQYQTHPGHAIIILNQVSMWGKTTKQFLTNNVFAFNEMIQADEVMQTLDGRWDLTVELVTLEVEVGAEDVRRESARESIEKLKN